jgi:hypothetical protein
MAFSEKRMGVQAREEKGVFVNDGFAAFYAAALPRAGVVGAVIELLGLGRDELVLSRSRRGCV